MNKYYQEHPEQLSEKLKDQYDLQKQDIIFLIFVILAVGVSFLLK
jgi:hypothetical protein